MNTNIRATCIGRRSTKLLIVLAVFIVLFIWGNSLLPSSLSSAISSGLVRWLFPSSSGAATEETILRKLGHLLEFFALGGVLFVLRDRLKTSWSMLFLAGLAVAVIDESIQLFSEGRSSQVTDIWIDFTGFSLAVFIFSTVIVLIRRRSEKKAAI